MSTTSYPERATSTTSEDSNGDGDLAALDEGVDAAVEADASGEKSEENEATACAKPPAAPDLAESNQRPAENDPTRDERPLGCIRVRGCQEHPSEKVEPRDIGSDFVEVVYDEEHLKAMAADESYISYAGSFNVYPRRGLDYFI